MYINDITCCCTLHRLSLIIVFLSLPCVTIPFLRHSKRSFAGISIYYSLSVASHPSLPHVANRRPHAFVQSHESSPILVLISARRFLHSHSLTLFSLLSSVPLGPHITYRSHLTYNEVTCDCCERTQPVRVTITATGFKWFKWDYVRVQRE